ncbi:MAG: membrane dipeptidase [Clostridia bacterium]
MRIIDAHCDTLLAAVETKQTLCDNELQVDLRHMPSGSLQFFAMFLSPSYDREKALAYEESMVQLFFSEVKNLRMTAVLEQKDLDEKGVSGILSCEGLSHLHGDVEGIRALYARGVRSLSLTWNRDNEFSGGAAGDKMQGLTMKGREALRMVEDLGILLDVSHLSDQGFYDACGMSEKPFIASHSNARGVCSHPRNLDDGMIKALAGAGGVMGINVYGSFLKDSPPVGIGDVVRHIEYVCGLVGAEHVGFGSDFDGIPRDHSALADTRGWMDVVRELERLNYSPEDIGRIAGGNYVRVLRNVIK